MTPEKPPVPDTRPAAAEPFWSLNLAAEPFERAPASVALWLTLALIGSLLLLLDITLVGRETLGIWRASRVQRQHQATALRLQSRIRQTQRTLESLDTKAFRRECEFLNQQVQARRFSWTRLLDALEHVMPPGVRVTSITPRVIPGPAEHVLIGLTVEAKTLQDFTGLITKFYESGEFYDVQIERESPDPARGLITYDLSVSYRPRPRAQPSRPSKGVES